MKDPEEKVLCGKIFLEKCIVFLSSLDHPKYASDASSDVSS